MVAQGHAWSYRLGQDPGPYLQEQRQAQAARRGLFAQDRPEQPRQFRQRHGSCKPGG
jgi:endonuclease YncB( thermonuclease family)